MSSYKKYTLTLLTLVLSSSLQSMEAPAQIDFFPLLLLPGDVRNLVFTRAVHANQNNIIVIAKNIVRLSRVNRALHAFINSPKNMTFLLDSLPYIAHRLDIISGQGRRSWGSTNRPQLNKMPVFHTQEMYQWITKTENELEMGKELLDAAGSKKVDLVAQLLANKKIDLNFQDGFGFNALMEAVRARTPNKQDQEMVTLLLDAQANPDLQNISSGNTPLMQAAWRGKSEIVEALLTTGADASLKNKKGETALKRAEHYATEVVRLSNERYDPYRAYGNLYRTASILENHNKLLEMKKKELQS